MNNYERIAKYHRLDVDKIQNHNTNGMCGEEYCSQKQTCVLSLNLDSGIYFLYLCDYHADKISEMSGHGDKND